MTWANDDDQSYQMSNQELLKRACIKIQEALLRGDVALADTFLALASKRLESRRW